MMPMPTTMTPEREGRCVLVRVSLSLLQLMMTTGSETVADGIEPVKPESVSVSVAQCIDGLPRDATLVRAAIDAPLGELRMIFAHPSFRAIPAGVRYPNLLPTFRQVVWRVDASATTEMDTETLAAPETETHAGDASAGERRARARKKRIETGGYVPVTLLGPRPEGEPLLASRTASRKDNA